MITAIKISRFDVGLLQYLCNTHTMQCRICVPTAIPTSLSPSCIFSLNSISTYISTLLLSLSRLLTKLPTLSDNHFHYNIHRHLFYYIIHTQQESATSRGLIYPQQYLPIGSTLFFRYNIKLYIYTVLYAIRYWLYTYYSPPSLYHFFVSILS